MSREYKFDPNQIIRTLDDDSRKALYQLIKWHLEYEKCEFIDDFFKWLVPLGFTQDEVHEALRQLIRADVLRVKEDEIEHSFSYRKGPNW